MLERVKREKAITLIALVVTIVVLLILAGVSINLVIGNNGIITKAGDARDANKYATIKDEYELYKSNQYIESATGGSGGKTFSEFLAEMRSMETMQEIMDALMLIVIMTNKNIISNDFLSLLSCVPLHSFR